MCSTKDVKEFYFYVLGSAKRTFENLFPFFRPPGKYWCVL